MCMIYVKSIVGCYMISIIFTLLFWFAVDSGACLHEKHDYEHYFKVALTVIILLNTILPAPFGLLLGEIISDDVEMQQIVIATFEQELYACPTAHIELSSETMDALDIDPCPFCGEDSTVIIANNFGDYQYYIHCSECGRRSERVTDSVEQLISEWNGEE